MKSNVLKMKFVLVALALVAFASCQKELIQPLTNTTEQVTGPTQEIAMIADPVNDAYLSVETLGGNESEALYSDNEGLPSEYLLESSSFDAIEKGKPSQLIRCLKAQNLSDTQVIAIRKAFKAYEECKAISIKKHRMAYAELHKKVEAARLELVKKYKNNEITKAEFEAGMKSLRERFNNALKQIKESYAASLKACFERFMAHIKDILTEAQWKAFLACQRGK